MTARKTRKTRLNFGAKLEQGKQEQGFDQGMAPWTAAYGTAILRVPTPWKWLPMGASGS